MSKDQQLLEEAYKSINENEKQNFSYYSGPAEDVMFLDDLDVDNFKRKVTQEGKHLPSQRIADDLEAAHAYCVNASKTAHLSKHTSRFKLSQLLNLIEEIFEDLDFD